MRAEVMHVPNRADRAAMVARQGEVFDICVHEDPTHRGPLPTMVDCLSHALESGRRVGDDIDWVLVLQDDAEPLPRVEEYLLPFLAHSPEPVLGLSNVAGTNAKAVAAGAAYTVQPLALAGGAFAVRGDVLARAVPWMRSLWEIERYIHDDMALSAFARHIGASTARVAWSLFRQPLKTTLRTSKVRHAPSTHTIEDAPEPEEIRWDRVVRNRDRTFSREQRALMLHSYPRLAAMVPTNLTREDWRDG